MRRIDSPERMIEVIREYGIIPFFRCGVPGWSVEEIMVVAHSGCGACHMSFGHFKEEMLQRGVPEGNLKRNDIDLDKWLEGFHFPEESVRNTVAVIKEHPLMPIGITVRGFIMDSATGELTEIK